MLRSQKVRELAPEMDPLRLGMGWKLDDLEKPQILIESTYGNSHPGSSHLNRFVEEAVKGVDENGGKAARYFATSSSRLLCALKKKESRPANSSMSIPASSAAST